MAANAYVLIKLDPGETRTVVARIREIPGALVREVLGPYDLIVELESDTQEDIGVIVRNKIRPVPGINETITCACF